MTDTRSVITFMSVDDPCGWCGHEWSIHNDGCLDGWKVIAGEIVEGPDACACIAYQEPT
jgi:hypothetical protein